VEDQEKEDVKLTVGERGEEEVRLFGSFMELPRKGPSDLVGRMEVSLWKRGEGLKRHGNIGRMEQAYIRRF